MQELFQEMGVSWEEILASMKMRERDKAWFRENLAELRKEYSQHFVAVDDGKVVAASADPDELTKQLKEMGFRVGMILVEFVSPDDWIVVL